MDVQSNYHDENKKVKLHFFRKQYTRSLAADRWAVSIYVDNNFCFDMSAGEEREFEVTPGKHVFEAREKSAFYTRCKSQEFDVLESTTDVYISFGKYVYGKSSYLGIYSVAQCNMFEYKQSLAKPQDKKLRILALYGVLSCNIDFKVSIDGKPYQSMSMKDTYEVDISAGKHMVVFETYKLRMYKFIDIPQDCRGYQMTVGVVNKNQFSAEYAEFKVVDESSFPELDSALNQKQIDCTITRQRKFGNNMYKVQVCIDDRYNTFIKGGEVLRTTLTPGNHTIIIKKPSIVDVRKINVPENAKNVNIIIACGIMQAGESAIIINK